MRRIFSLAGVLVLVSLMACGGGEVQRKPSAKVSKPAAPAKKKAPAWVKGDFPAERAFFGSGRAPAGGDRSASVAVARTKALENLNAELELLVNVIEYDHSEQVAEIITSYPTDEFNAHIKACAEIAVEKAPLEIYDGQGVTYVLLRVTPENVYEAINQREGLPEEQKKRIRNYQGTFTDNVMTNLGR